MNLLQKLEREVREDGLTPAFKYMSRYGEVFVAEQFRIGDVFSKDPVTKLPHYRVIFGARVRYRSSGKTALEGSFFDIRFDRTVDPKKRQEAIKREIFRYFEMNKNVDRLAQE